MPEAYPARTVAMTSAPEQRLHGGVIERLEPLGARSQLRGAKRHGSRRFRCVGQVIVAHACPGISIPKARSRRDSPR